MNALSRAVAKRTAATTGKDNRGFSLVELIIVIAIMAVLTSILAPQLIKYIERARIQKDQTAASEVLRTVQLAMANEGIYNQVVANTSNVTVVVKDNTAISCSGSDLLEKEVVEIIGTSIDFTSKQHNGKTYTVTITPAGMVSGDVTTAWS